MNHFIDNFIYGISNTKLNDLYSDYNNTSYGDLMDYPIKKLTLKQKKNALTEYLTFIMYKDCQTKNGEIYNERMETLKPIIESLDYETFLDVMTDQYFQEPLYHEANKMYH